MTSFVCLLRGINVGGKNIIKMADLRACFEALGFSDVSTFIQSGNVLFKSKTSDAKALQAKIEKTLAKAFDYDASVVIRSRSQMQATLAKAPKGFGQKPDKVRYDFLFLKDAIASSAALKEIPAREGVDQVNGGPGVVYFSRLISQVSKTYLTKIIGKPIYKQMTIRNWNTTRELLARMEF